MSATGIWHENQLADILAHAEQSRQNGHEFAAAVPDYCNAGLGTIFTRELLLFAIHRREAKINGATKMIRSFEWLPSPPEALGSLITGRTLHITGQENYEGWPSPGTFIEIAPDSYEGKPGLLVDIGRCSLQNIHFIRNNFPGKNTGWATWQRFDWKNFLKSTQRDAFDTSPTRLIPRYTREQFATISK